MIYDEGVMNLLASLKYIRVNYTHFDSPEHCVYEALRPKLRSGLLFISFKMSLMALSEIILYLNLDKTDSPPALPSSGQPDV